MGLEVWPGYETAIRVYEADLMLCVENRFKVLRTDTMLKIMTDELLRANQNAPRMQAKMEELYIGQTIVTHYNNKLYRLSRIDWSPSSQFTKADGSEITLQAYFKEQYGLDITDTQQPIIISEGKPKQPGEPPQLTYPVPKFCRPTGLTDDMRKNFRLMRALSFHTRLTPDKRYQSTGMLIQEIASNPSCVALLNAWQLRLGNDLVNVRARELPTERLVGKMDRNPAGFVGQNAEWARECKRNGNYSSTDMLNWIMIAPQSPVSIQAAQKFIAKVSELGKGLAMNIGEPLWTLAKPTNVNDYMKAVQDSVAQVEGHDIHLVVVLLPDDNKTRYDSLKKLLCTSDNLSRAIPSQCVLQSTLVGRSPSGGENKNFDSIVLKIVLQMNGKMGGALWKVAIPVKNAMIMGYDLYHEGQNCRCMCLYLRQRLHAVLLADAPSRKSYRARIESHALCAQRFAQYYLSNNQLPERLFLYRDRAGDGQIPYIRNHEVNMVREACAEVVRKETMRLSCPSRLSRRRSTCVSSNEPSNTLVNPNPGTIVDDIVTRPERYDFYLVPQFVNQGTVTPVCYNIIFDNTGLKPDQQQKLAFKLCHMYYNWQGGVSIIRTLKMDSFVSNLASAIADDQKFPSSNVWGSAAGRLNFDSPLLFRDQRGIDGNNIAAGDSSLFSPAKSGSGLPSLSRTENRGQPLSGAGDVLSIDEICRQLPNLSLMASQDDSFERGLGTGDRDSNGHRLRARSALPSWAMDSKGRLILNIGEILTKGLLQQFAKDRLGSQHLQTLYPNPNTEDRLVIIKEVLEDPIVFVNLSSDVFGNFFVQQIVGCATASEQLYVFNRLKNHMFKFCLNRYSCRVVQKALDVLPHDLKLGLIVELHHVDLVRLCVDQNGNHVIQKILTGFPVKIWSFLIETFLRERHLFETAENKYGCRIVQLAVEQLAGDFMRTHQSEVLLKRMMAVITANCMRLTLNEFSNYVIQFIIGCESLAHYRDMIINNCLLSHLLSMSQEKYASHVIEKAMEHAPRDLLHEMMDEIFDGYVPHPETHRDALDIMMFHQFGNYIIQRMLSICVDAVRVWKSGGTMVDMNQRLTWLRRLSERIATNECRLAKYSSGKKMIDMLNEVPPILRNPDCTQADLNRARAF